VILATASPDCQAVFKSASPFGAHPALLQHYLDVINWPEKDLVHDLVNGFPFVGDVPVNPEAVYKPVRRASISEENLVSLGNRRFRSLCARQRRRRPDSSLELDAEVFKQTIAEWQLGRMRMTRPQLVDLEVDQMITSRFWVTQLDSSSAQDLVSRRFL
jgi:hypothetical protein